MSKKAKSIVKRVTALFLALTIVMSFVLTRSSDRVLHATAIDEEEYESIVESEQLAEAENLSFETVEMTLPTEPEPVEEPEPAAETVDETQETAAAPVEEPADNADAGNEDSLSIAVDGGSQNEDASLDDQDSDVSSEDTDEEGMEDGEEDEESSDLDADEEDEEAVEGELRHFVCSLGLWCRAGR